MFRLCFKTLAFCGIVELLIRQVGNMDYGCKYVYTGN